MNLFGNFDSCGGGNTPTLASGLLIQNQKSVFGQLKRIFG